MRAILNDFEGVCWLTDKSFDELYTRPQFKLGSNSSSRLKPTETSNSSPLKRTFAISLGFESKAGWLWALRVLLVNQGCLLGDRAVDPPNPL